MQVYEELQDNSKEKYNSLIIIDDFQVSLKDPKIIKILQKIVTKNATFANNNIVTSTELAGFS